MITYWQQLLTLLGGFSVIVLAVAWLARSLVTHFLAKDIEQFKLSLRSQADLEIERFRTALQISASRDQVRFSRLHEKQADAIALLYEQLLETIQHLSICASWTQQEIDFSNFSSEAIKKAMKSYVDAKHTFKIHEIYFDPELCILLDEFFELLMIARQHVSMFDDNWKDRKGEAFLDSWGKVTEKLPRVSDALRARFRGILGVQQGSEQDKALA